MPHKKNTSIYHILHPQPCVQHVPCFECQSLTVNFFKAVILLILLPKKVLIINNIISSHYMQYILHFQYIICKTVPPLKCRRNLWRTPCISRIINIDEDNTVLMIGVSLSYMRIVCTRIVLALCVKKRDLRIDPWMTIQFIQSNMLFNCLTQKDNSTRFDLGS